MRDLVLTPRPQRQVLTTKRTAIAAAQTRSLTRPVRPTITRPDFTQAASGSDGDPYVDYARYFTAQGGILIVYKDIDESGWHSLWRFFAWTLFTGPEVWLALVKVPIESDWIRYTCCGLAAFVNLLIVAKSVELFRRIEVRPDCLILDDEQIFWANKMESLPSFTPDEGGNMRLTGIYGTRYVEFLTVRKFDQFDSTPQVLAAGFANALQQLWLNRP